MQIKKQVIGDDQLAGFPDEKFNTSTTLTLYPILHFMTDGKD
jgi:hypothetical protein